MVRMIISPSTTVPVNVLDSQMAPTTSAVLDCKSKVLEATDAEKSTVLQSQLMSLIAVARVARVIAVVLVGQELVIWYCMSL